MQAGDIIQHRFVLEQHVATGGMSHLYRGHDVAANAPVAIKVATPPSRETVLRFDREAALLAELSHPGIVRYMAHGHAGASHYLVMEWLEGQDLSHSLRRRDDTQVDAGAYSDTIAATGAPTEVFDTLITAARVRSRKPEQANAPRVFNSPFSVEDNLVFGRRVASAVAELHSRDVIHRDIKPANLFLPAGLLTQVKLIDLGIARPVYQRRKLTQPGTLLGTPHYMAPEQIVARYELAPATDVWAIGCVLYQLLSGMPPFDGGHRSAVLASVLASDPAPIQLLRADIPPELAATIMRALTKDVSRRQPDAAALAEELAGIEQRVGARA